jgi:hypothetical protein
MPKRVWTIDEVRRLGLATDVETAASVLRIGRTRAYGLVKAGTFPVKVLRIGKSYVVPVEGLLTLLGVEVFETGDDRNGDHSRRSA